MMEAIRKNGKKVIKNRLRGQNLNVIETTKNCSNFRMELQKWMKHQKKMVVKKSSVLEIFTNSPSTEQNLL